MLSTRHCNGSVGETQTKNPTLAIREPLVRVGRNHNARKIGIENTRPNLFHGAIQEPGSRFTWVQIPF
jgi:hypothetical protein